mmetsp:Transcript_68718/g.108270  ORF Transcript_68718/g.108270 Transcript_68718/m.108270 type:complete len:204 (+) Transcript_68718:464-1075(+)
MPHILLKPEAGLVAHLAPPFRLLDVVQKFWILHLVTQHIIAIGDVATVGQGLRLLVSQLHFSGQGVLTSSHAFFEPGITELLRQRIEGLLAHLFCGFQKVQLAIPLDLLLVVFAVAVGQNVEILMEQGRNHPRFGHPIFGDRPFLWMGPVVRVEAQVGDDVVIRRRVGNGTFQGLGLRRVQRLGDQSLELPLMCDEVVGSLFS